MRRWLGGFRADSWLKTRHRVFPSQTVLPDTGKTASVSQLIQTMAPNRAHRKVSTRDYVEFALRTIIMEYDMDSLILNVLRSLPPCQIQAGEANERYSASVCKKNEPDPLPCPVFRP